MKPNLTSRIALALLATASIHTASSTGQKPTAQKPAANTAVEPVLALRFGVAGLTRDNASQTQAGLAALTIQTRVCEACQFEQPGIIRCPKCAGELQAATKPLLSSAITVPDEGSITLGLHAQRVARLSEIEAALRKGGVTIDPARLPLAGHMVFVLAGGGAADVERATKALQDAKLFEDVTATFDAATSEIRVRVRCTIQPAPTRAAVGTLLEVQKLKLADVHFGLPSSG